MTYSARAALSIRRCRSRHQASQSIDVDRNPANPPPDGFKLADGRESAAFPVLEGVIERPGVVGELAQALPSLSRIPGEAELRTPINRSLQVAVPTGV
ncbi:MAG: hypothetical protein WAU49_06740 [Steroidobacteraceae bacterium]